MKSRAAVLWTGGKDSALACYKARLQGYQIIGLFTFVPHQGEFLAHPISFMRHQAEALGLRHHTVEVREPFEKGYEAAISHLKERYGADTLVTGDIDEVDCHPNWVRKCSARCDINVLTPLWKLDRVGLLNELLSCKFKAIFSCVKEPWFSKDWLCTELDRISIERLCLIDVQPKLDICGEQGEYHTLVLDGPTFKKSVNIIAYSRRIKDSLMYLDIRKVVLKEKRAFSRS